jgi:DNA-directed RNA polymerase specialized sigma24 family protein
MASKKSQATVKKPPEKKEKPKKKKPRGKDRPHYVNSKDFLRELTTYYGQGDENVSEILGVYIYKIATGLSYAPNFINYSYRDDMVGDAIVKMFSALKNKKFDLDSGNNPFSYFTTIAFHAFINRIKKEKKQREVVSEYQEQVFENLVLEGQASLTSSSHDETSNDS